jgi:hypothetical protein
MSIIHCTLYIVVPVVDVSTVNNIRGNHIRQWKMYKVQWTICASNSFAALTSGFDQSGSEPFAVCRFSVR